MIMAYEATKNNGNISQNEASGGVGEVVHTARGCIHKEFLNRQQHKFSGTEGVVGLARWFEKMESVFHINKCAINCQVKFATSTLSDGPLTWWNSYINTVGIDGGRLTQGTIMCNNFLPKRQNIARAYTARTNEKGRYVGKAPFCNKCKLHHTGPYTVKCGNCKRVSHMTKDCRTLVHATTQRAPVTNQKAAVTCYECRKQGHYQSECLKLKNLNHGNQAGNGEAQEHIHWEEEKPTKT
nr:reverse transcriptase domain-containing protein [Tanacetum cinerariifolium]